MKQSSQQGYLVISDITGYTAFLSGSELEHAEDSLSSLLNVLIEHTRPPLVVSRLEGDAVISYALDGSFLQGQTLVESIENTYVAFRRALERMVLNTTCTCNACRNIPSLDLKFFVHYGAFMLQALGEHTELIGSDVNLIHRLTKNDIAEKIGTRAYSVYTEAAVEALGIAELCSKFARHTESYEHLGEVAMFVQNMEEVWQLERTKNHVAVETEDALWSADYEYPLPMELLWDYSTKPENRAVLTGSDSQRITGASDGRIRTGASYQGAHGNTVTLHTIVDWQPPTQYTIETPAVFGATSLITTKLTPTPSGTKVTALFGKPRGSPFARVVSDLGFRLIIKRIIKKNVRRFEELLTKEIDAGRIIQPPNAEVAPEQIREAASKSLA